jgi:hypothetical protein
MRLRVCVSGWAASGEVNGRTAAREMKRRRCIEEMERCEDKGKARYSSVFVHDHYIAGSYRGKGTGEQSKESKEGKYIGGYGSRDIERYVPEWTGSE